MDLINAPPCPALGFYSVFFGVAVGIVADTANYAPATKPYQASAECTRITTMDAGVELDIE